MGVYRQVAYYKEVNSKGEIKKPLPCSK